MLPTPVDTVVVHLTHDEGQSGSNQSRIDVEVRVFDVAQGREIARVCSHTPSGTIAEIGRLMRSDGVWHFIGGGVRRHGFLADLISATGGSGSMDTALSPGEPRSDVMHDPLNGIAAETGTGYCDTSMRRAFVLRAAGTGISPDEAEIMVDLELERLRVANETVLLQRLDSVLHRFTQDDGRLDDKERRDALQIVCRAAPGYAQGLRHDVADGHVVRFCRERGVKIKVGLLRWQVP